MSNDNQNAKATLSTVMIAVVTTVGVLGGALFANWDKIFPQSTDQVGTNVPQPESPEGDGPPVHNPSSEASPKAQKNCVGFNIKYYPLFLFEGRPPASNVGFIITVFPGQPAAVAGLRQGDVILSINGRPITSVQVIPEVISNLEDDDTVFIRIVRPSDFTISSQEVTVFGPFDEGDFEVALQPCST